MLDYECNSLWGDDEFTVQKFGNNIEDLENLGLTKKTIELSKFVTELHYKRLNPIYQTLPSFWYGEMHLYFQNQLKQLFENILNEIGKDFEIENTLKQEINSKIEIEKINFELKEFLNNPNLYYRQNGISINKSDEDEKQFIDLEYQKWKKIELEILNQLKF